MLPMTQSVTQHSPSPKPSPLSAEALAQAGARWEGAFKRDGIVHLNGNALWGGPKVTRGEVA
jgi:hypothetical protein